MPQIFLKPRKFMQEENGNTVPFVSFILIFILSSYIFKYSRWLRRMNEIISNWCCCTGLFEFVRSIFCSRAFYRGSSNLTSTPASLAKSMMEDNLTTWNDSGFYGYSRVPMERSGAMVTKVIQTQHPQKLPWQGSQCQRGEPPEKKQRKHKVSFLSLLYFA